MRINQQKIDFKLKHERFGAHMNKPLTVRDHEEISGTSNAKKKKIKSILLFVQDSSLYTSIFLKEGISSWQTLQFLSRYKISTSIIASSRRPWTRITCLFRNIFGWEKESRWPALGRAMFWAKRLSFHLRAELYRTLKGIQFDACSKDQITKVQGIWLLCKARGGRHTHIVKKYPSWRASNDVATPEYG